MSYQKSFDYKTIKRIPPMFVLCLVLLLGLPIIALNYLDIDFSVFSNSIKGTSILTPEVVAQIRGYFRQTLLEWAAFSLAAVTVLLAFTQFRMTKDKIALVIGLVILFSGAVQALHTVMIDGLALNFTNQKNLDAVIWTFSNIMTGLIFIIGLTLTLKDYKKERFRVVTFFLLIFLLLVIAISLIYYAAYRAQLPNMWFKYYAVSRPYDLIYLLIYLALILFVYPPAYKKYPYILTDCIFYMAVTQIVIAIYLMLLSSSPYDSGYNIAYFLKIIFYFIPFSCFIINYIYTYNEVLVAQKKLRISQEKLKYIASHDVLTDLYNRREFEILLNKSIANCQREENSFALLIIDIDNFKSINDTLGHIHGDNFLKQFSDNLAQLTRKGDVLSRIGGDEYTLITGKIKSRNDVKLLVERILESIATPLSVDGKLLSCTVSIGIAIYPSDGKDTETLLKHADIAMYSAKKSGKNTYRFYEEKLSSKKNREAEIEYYLRNALKNEELRLYFQPKFQLVTKEIVGAEVLLRWHNSTLGDISPDEFIPIAENTGLMINIGEWVLNTTCQQAKKWLDAFNKPIIFSVNISTIQFENPLFFRKLSETLQDHNYPPALFELEITESLLMSSNADLNKTLEKIASLGVNISIDDFGMGYSSLSRLKSLPIKTMKIDKFFISEIKNDDDKIMVIDTIIKLTQEMGMNIIAEGIETEEQVNYLVSRNCYLGQGFLLSKPLDAKKFEQLAYNNRS